MPSPTQRRRHGHRRRIPRTLLSLTPLAAVAALLAPSPAVQAAVAPAAVQAAVPATIPLTVKNDSRRAEPVYLYNLGTELSTGRQGWADAGGTFHPWPAGGPVPTPAPDASIPGPAAGQSLTIRMPKFSGRVYFSYGRKLVFQVATGGLVQPAVQNPSDPNRDILFNWSEYTLNDAGLWINSTQVDMFSAPYAVGVKRPDGGVATTGHLRPGGYRGFFDALRGQPGGWAGLIRTRSDGTLLRALAPGHGIEAGALPGDVMAGYIDRVWARYASSTLTVTPFADRPSVVYYGRVSGDTMNFTDGSGAVVTSFRKPDSDSVFGCHKLLDAPNDQVRGPISRTLCAGYNRSTLLTNPHQPDTSAAGFYQDAVTNHYSRKVHAQMADGKAYGFAFDDVGAQESLVHDADPRQAFLTLDPLD
ncbi:glycoside hydrolase family 64 protein [Streptomyces sp. NPDC046374]|uniref:glycoside hydrolase family 64 protein n=1 Tax=Streptomyces sp. NPDC046374 TaxID=3154917 RepID=UPI0033C4FBA4